jgi:prenyltransferase beta subunit
MKILQQSKDDLTYHLTSHLRLNAVYWGFTALYILGKPDALDREEMIEFVMSCWDEGAGNVFIYFVVAFHLGKELQFTCDLNHLQLS